MYPRFRFHLLFRDRFCHNSLVLRFLTVLIYVLKYPNGICLSSTSQFPSNRPACLVTVPRFLTGTGDTLLHTHGREQKSITLSWYSGRSIFLLTISRGNPEAPPMMAFTSCSFLALPVTNVIAFAFEAISYLEVNREDNVKEIRTDNQGNHRYPPQDEPRGEPLTGSRAS